MIKTLIGFVKVFQLASKLYTNKETNKENKGKFMKAIGCSGTIRYLNLEMRMKKYIDLLNRGNYPGNKC